MSQVHSFHIPVMGLGFTIDTPLKVAQYGMDSVVSIGDDMLLEKLRAMYSKKYGLPYDEITDKMEDARARRITSYLNMMNSLVLKKFEALKKEVSQKKTEIDKYFNMLPDGSKIKEEFTRLKGKLLSLNDMREWVKNRLSPGNIDVNIMTKVDKDNYLKKEKLPVIYNDAHAALRGYANSNLRSGVVFSAGMNPRLYSYLEQFEDFYPDESGDLKKKIILKVSDYRSALIQGKFMAKKGLWVSEYRIESGLNCGGHAFASEGYLMGPILSEFKEKKQELIETVHKLMIAGLARKGRRIPEEPLPVKISAQGGVGTAEEHQFLLDHYQVDSVGWGTPFLLVPEATTVDPPTMAKLARAQEEDLYLSDISPLGVPFNNLRDNTKDLEKHSWIFEGKAGSPCPKRFLAIDTTYTEKPICTASRQYQRLKLDDLEKQGLSPNQFKRQFNKITNKTCLCVGLGTSPLLVNDMDTRVEGTAVSICPGPNMAYFSEVVGLNEMTDHIYGRANIIKRKDRPNMFIKELDLYLDYLRTKIEEARGVMTAKLEKSLVGFAQNLQNGITYYQGLFSGLESAFDGSRSKIHLDLGNSKKALEKLFVDIKSLATAPYPSR